METLTVNFVEKEECSECFKIFKNKIMVPVDEAFICASCYAKMNKPLRKYNNETPWKKA